MIYRNYSIEPAFTERGTYVGQVNGRMLEAGSLGDFEVLFHNAVDEMLGGPEQRKKKLWWVPLAALAALLLLLVITKPSHDRHLRVIARTAAGMVDAKGYDLGLDLSWVKGTISTALIKRALEGQVYFNDYVVCNVSYVRVAGERQNLTVGVLGMVFTVSEEQIIRFVNELIESFTDTASEYLEGFLDTAGESVSNFFDGVMESADGVLESAGDLIDSAGTAISKFIDGLF